MATVGTSYLTLADLYKRSEPDGSLSPIIEILAKMNPILQDAMTVECNNGTKHLTTVRTGLPSGTWRKLYQGVQPTKSSTAQVEDTTGMYESWSEVDAKLVDLSGNPAQFRLSESMAFLEAMSIDMASTLFYGDTTVNPERFLGLHPRFNLLSTDPTQSGSQIVSAGGTGSDLTSIWFVVWGDRTAHLLYPKGSKAGLQRDDKSKQTKTNADGSVFDVYREKFSWDIGLSLRDFRYVSRVCNIETPPTGTFPTTLIDLMLSAYYKLWQRRTSGGKAAIYCNRQVKENLHILALSKVANSTLRFEKVEGEEVMSFMGMPIRECDAIINTESQIS